VARTLSAALLTAQQTASKTPAVRVLINGVDYSSRGLFVEHHEEPYRDWATIILNNADRGLDGVATLSSNLLGYRFRIAYGYYTGEIVAEPNGDGAGNEYVESADLWVKAQKMVSSPGQLECLLYCEGQWDYLREQRLMALPAVGEFEKGDPDDAGNDPYYLGVFDKTKTVYQLIESVIENAMGWTLNAFAGVQDAIINSFYPYFSIEELPNAGDVLSGDGGGGRSIGLIRMTKCYLRAKANLIWELVFPESGNTVDETYFSASLFTAGNFSIGIDYVIHTIGTTDFTLIGAVSNTVGLKFTATGAGSGTGTATAYHFIEYAEQLNLVTPNRIVVFANNPNKLEAWPEPVMVADTGAYDATHPGQPDLGNYTEVIDFTLDGTITTQGDANLRAEAIQTRAKAETMACYLIVPHDCRVELYDRVEVDDQRGH